MPAIQPDVDNNAQADQQVERQLSAREIAMQAISERRIEAFEKESGVKIERAAPAAAAVDPDVDPDDQVDLPQNGAGNDPDDQLALQTQAAPPPDILKTKIKVKIAGEESEATVEEMQREFQKGRTADKRLDEINRRERALAEREAAAQQAAQTVAPRTQNVDNPAKVDPQVAKQFTSALFEGDEDKAVQAFNDAVANAVNEATKGRTDATPVDIDQITEGIEQRFAVKSALKQSKTDYPQMYEDPDLEALGALKIRAKQAEGFSFADALEETGKELATKFGWKTSGRQEPANSTTRDTKLARKQALDPIEGANVKSSTTEAVPLTNSQIIANMAKSRPGYTA